MTDQAIPHIPRGSKAALKNGALPEMISPYLRALIQETGGANGPIGRQFIAQPEKEQAPRPDMKADPLLENVNEVAPGLIYKYRGKIDKNGVVQEYGRALWTISRFCASYCRFCTRGRIVGTPAAQEGNDDSALTKAPYLSEDDIKQVLSYIKDHKECNDIILSGGDPMLCPEKYLTSIISGLVKLQKSGDLDTIRIDTRLPVQHPRVFHNWHYKLLSKIKNPYIVIHINHPDELTPETLHVIERLKKDSNAVVLSQSVLLKGVNDSVETLKNLFNKLSQNGIMPYYLYQNDPIPWATHFTVPLDRAIKLWQQLRPQLSGIAATARFVIDTPDGYGKIPVPEGDAWEVDYTQYRDFKREKHIL